MGEIEASTCKYCTNTFVDRADRMMPFVDSCKTNLQNLRHVAIVRGTGAEPSLDILILDCTVQILIGFRLQEALIPYQECAIARQSEGRDGENEQWIHRPSALLEHGPEGDCLVGGSNRGRVSIGLCVGAGSDQYQDEADQMSADSPVS
jgi:hypothetical protein